MISTTLGGRSDVSATAAQHPSSGRPTASGKKIALRAVTSRLFVMEENSLLRETNPPFLFSNAHACGNQRFNPATMAIIIVC